MDETKQVKKVAQEIKNKLSANEIELYNFK